MRRYKLISLNNKQVYLHRLLMEKKLKRKLTFNEVVHHINGNKLDNRMENLELLSRSEHMKHHANEPKFRAVILMTLRKYRIPFFKNDPRSVHKKTKVICSYCGKEGFRRTITAIYCSNKCGKKSYETRLGKKEVRRRWRNYYYKYRDNKL